MTTQDITRHLLQPGKHYSAARMQQGRSVLDSDWNEDSMLEAEDLRATLAELTGGHGSPNAGFMISDIENDFLATLDGLNPENGLNFNFTIAAGSMYVGGLRVELGNSEEFFTQSDWLRFDELHTNVPRLPFAEDLAQMPGEVRYDLVYLHVWEQIVSMVEDRELRERALGGSDTTTRVRRMRRVEVLTDVGSDHVDEAFAALVTKLEDENGTFDPGHAELVSNAKLTVSAITEGPPSACGPIVSGGYLGNEHQAIRVELRSARTFTWGFCNAAPLHRVRLVTQASGGTTFEFITQPHDQVARPRADQIVELLSWSAELTNGEHVAELNGPLFRVMSGYNAETRRITLDQQLPVGMAEWVNAHGGTEPHFFLRIWDRGPDTTSLAEILFVEGEPVPLGYTGLQVAFEPSGRLGDHWVIAARKGAMARLLPWELLDGAAPHGTRHFYAPLAIIRWNIGSVPNSDFPPGIPTILDARRRIQPLCERGCCTVTVGDGVTSHGQVDSLADAVALLPIAGGRICLLPGQHEGDVEITGRSHMEIVGCGPTSVLVNADPVTPAGSIATAGPPLLLLTDCTDVVLRNFSVAADASVGIKIRNSTGQSERVRLERLSFSTTGTANLGVSYALPQAAVLALGCNDLEIVDCRVDVEDVLNYMPALVVGGSRMRLYDNQVRVGSLDAPADWQAMGGIQVLSQSTDVELVGNRIHGGWGHGISLGHVFAIDPPASPVVFTLAQIWDEAERGLGEAITEQYGWAPVAGAPVVALLVGEFWTPAGPLADVRIRNNDIRGMRLSGISTAIFFDTQDPERARFIVADELEISANIIVGNALANLPVTKFVDGGDFHVAFGGVAIAAGIGVRIHENLIRDQGFDATVPICGVGVVAGQNIVIDDNRIVDNGALATPDTVIAAPGMRGGICINEVCAVRGYTFDDAVSNVTVPRPAMSFDGPSVALKVRKNEVSQRTGKALWIIGGFGPVTITENSLHSYGDPVSGVEIPDSELRLEKPPLMNVLPLLAQGACVEIRNYGTTAEVAYAGTAVKPKWVDSSSPVIVDGRVLFCGNQTRLKWHWVDGYATSVLISSQDSIVGNYNVMVAEMGNVFDPDATGGATVENQEFLEEVIAGGSYSFLAVHCWFGASSTIQATGNRFEEPRWDALFSYLGGDAAAHRNSVTAPVTRANVATENVGSHCIIGQDEFVSPASNQMSQNNISIHVAALSTCDYDVKLTMPVSVQHETILLQANP